MSKFTLRWGILATGGIAEVCCGSSYQQPLTELTHFITVLHERSDRQPRNSRRQGYQA
jgi:hypothetical protein